MTHDYKRNGTTDLFVALNVATGEVLTDCRRRHTAADVLAFFKQIDKAVPRSLDLHVILDNLSAHTALELSGVGHIAPDNAREPERVAAELIRFFC